MTSITTHQTAEAMSIAIGSFDMTAYRASLRSILCRHIYQSDTLFKGFVFDKGLQLSKRPRMLNKTLLLSKSDSISNVCQFFKHQSITSLTRVNDFSADYMVDVSHPAFLFARKPYQSAFSTFRAFATKTLAKFRVMFSGMLNLFAREFKTVRSGGKIVDASVYPDNIATQISRRDANLFFKDKVDVKGFSLFLVNQSGGSGFLLFEQSSLEVAKSQLNLESASGSCKRYAFSLLDKSKQIFIKVKRFSLKGLRSAFSFGTDSCNGPNYIIRGQSVSFLEGIITLTVQFVAIPQLFLSSNSKSIIAGLCKLGNRILNSLSLIFINFKFALHCFNKLHTIDYTIRVLQKSRKRMRPHSPQSP